MSYWGSTLMLKIVLLIIRMPLLTSCIHSKISETPHFVTMYSPYCNLTVANVVDNKNQCQDRLSWQFPYRS